MCPMKSLQFFIEVEIMIIIIKELANESEGMYWGKQRKVKNSFCSNKKGNKKN